MSCVTRLLEGDLESGVAGRCLACGGAAAGRRRGGAWPVEWSGVEWSGGESSDWTVEWSGGAVAGRGGYI